MSRERLWKQRERFADLDPAQVHREGAPIPRPTQLAFGDLGINLRDVTFVVVDLETTGGRPGKNSITEIGAVKTRGGETLGEFSTLINPEVPIPAHITMLTGISTSMTYDAPLIAEALPKFIDFVVADSPVVLVAHNARFDVGHLRGAAQAVEREFPPVQVLDTLKLARRIFTRDEVPNYKLGTLAGFCHAAVAPTHRALDDARATVDVLYTMIERLGPLGVTHLNDLITASDPVPAKRRRRAVLADGLPKSPGVYRFLGPKREVLYVGTSVNVYKRVRQYFTAAEKRRRMAEMVDLAQAVEATATETVLEASVLELRQIQEFDPPYNRRSRRPNARPWLTLDWKPGGSKPPHLRVARAVAHSEIENCLGPFPSGKSARRAKELISDEAGLPEGGMRLERLPDFSDSPCHLSSHHSSPHPCVLPPRGRINPPDIAAARAGEILRGEVGRVWDHQMRKIADLAAAEQFEQASTERDRLRSLITTARRRERLLPLWSSPKTIAASRREKGWEVAIVSYGRLVAAARVMEGETPPELASRLERTLTIGDPPDRAGGYAHIEETEILAQWIADPRSRILAHTGPLPLAVPLTGAGRYVHIGLPAEPKA